MEKLIVRPGSGRADWAPSFGLDRWMEDAFGGLTNDVRSGMLAMDVLETDEAYTLHIDAPGARREDLDLTLERNQLTVRIDRVEEASDEGRRYLRRERSHQVAARTLRFPQRVDAEQVSASFQDGVLTVTVPKMADERARKVAIE